MKSLEYFENLLGGLGSFYFWSTFALRTSTERRPLCWPPYY